MCPAASVCPAAAVPEIEYGNMRPGLTRALGRLLFKLADLAVCYSQSAVREATENAGIPHARQRLVYLGFDERKIGASSVGASKERLVLTVAGVTASTLHEKHLFDTPEKRDLLERLLLSFAKESGWQLEAWAVFALRKHSTS